jgi:hypothetical protein
MFKKFDWKKTLFDLAKVLIGALAGWLGDGIL